MIKYYVYPFLLPTFFVYSKPHPSLGTLHNSVHKALTGQESAVWPAVMELAQAQTFNDFMNGKNRRVDKLELLLKKAQDSSSISHCESLLNFLIPLVMAETIGSYYYGNIGSPEAIGKVIILTSLLVATNVSRHLVHNEAYNQLRRHLENYKRAKGLMHTGITLPAYHN